jgi:methylated-DNA-[protein]-cysteine S-methyltransferase
MSGATMSTRHIVVDSPVGDLTLVTDGAALTALYFVEHKHAPGTERLGPQVEVGDAPEVLQVAVRQLEEYFAGRRTDFDLPLAPTGTAFQQQVWAALREIPYAQTRSYGQLAGSLGKPGASRAVGLANGRNPISIVVPCHRVIGADGSLTGYGGGAERKQTLLDLERRVGGVSLW